MRTTVDIDGPLLKDLKRLQKLEGKSFSRLVSDLLSEALGRRHAGRTAKPRFRWVSKPMGARVDIEDRDAVLGAMEERKR